MLFGLSSYLHQLYDISFEKCFLLFTFKNYVKMFLH